MNLYFYTRPDGLKESDIIENLELIIIYKMIFLRYSMFYDYLVQAAPVVVR